MSTLINPSSMRAFSLTSQIFNTTSFRKSKSKPYAPISKAKSSFSSSDWLGILSIAVCFVAAFVINIVVLFGVLSLFAPKLPLACLSIYGSGYGLLLLIGHLEKKEEETWTLAMRKSRAENGLVEVDEDEL